MLIPLPLHNDENVPEDAECDSCHYSTQHLHKVKPPFLSKRTEPHWFCDLCFSSFASNSVQYPDLYRESGSLMQHMCLMTNHILAAIRENV